MITEAIIAMAMGNWLNYVFFFLYLTVYIRPLQVLAYNTSSTSLALEWNEPGELLHGIFCGVEISYRVNGSSQTERVMVASGIRNYELTNLEPYTWYVVSVTPHTLEGEGKKSDEVVARTGGDG